MTPQEEFNTLPSRIRSIYNTCSFEEQTYLIRILNELAENGYSTTYENLWLEDYVEIPVDIDTFISDDRYLGKATDNGDAVYPFWKQCMETIFENPTKYSEIAFTGATRIGKTSTAVTCTAYMLYRLMCLRDPQRFYGKKNISKFSILFFNITKDLAKGVAFKEFQTTLRSSPWFNDHGTFSRSDQNYVYIPDGGKIEINYGSSSSHALGVQLYCLTGETEIVTNKGISKLEDVKDSSFRVIQYDPVRKSIGLSDDTTCELTGYASELIRLNFYDGSYIEGTPYHKILLADESYKTFDEVTLDDVLFSRLVMTSKEIIDCEDNPIPVYDVINATPNNNYMLSNGCIVHNCAVMDETNFHQAGVKDINKAKVTMQELYDTVVARVQGTFRMEGEVYGKVFCVSSKNSDSDFMEQHIQDQLNAGNDHLYVVDKPQWEVMPSTMFSSERFHIAVGDRYHKGFVVEDESEEALNELENQGYQVLDVPMDMKTNFLADFDISLRDIAGISVPGALSFITQDIIDQCTGDRHNPFLNPILEIGTQDSYSIEEFFHMENVDPSFKHCPCFIHLDLSLNDDKTGLGGVFLSGRKDMQGEDGKYASLPTFSHFFSLSVKAPRGDKIPYSKILNFILWLRRQGFNIVGISRDQFQSEYIGELLEEQGFKVTKLSVDRSPDPYQALRSIFLEKRIDLLPVSILQDELIHLQRDSVTGKIDHPVGGCFISSTEIRLSNGSTKTIKDLICNGYEGLEVYTVSDNKEIEVKPIVKVFYSKIAKELLEVCISDDDVVYCTPEHRFMLLDGSYKEAQDLRYGDVLMSLSFDNVVTSVKRIKDCNCRVYDIEVQDNHNFALASGVFVHNSKDTADCIAGSVWNAMMSNPGVPVDRKSVAKAISNVNTRVNSGKTGIDNIFHGNIRKY